MPTDTGLEAISALLPKKKKKRQVWVRIPLLLPSDMNYC